MFETERMDGKSVAADFGNRFAAEIRLPEALEEKLLCPFHYFGVADPVQLDLDRFRRNGRYDAAALEHVYTGADVLARKRVDAVQEALFRYEPELLLVKETWTGWKAKARLSPFPTDPDLNRLKQGLVRAAFITDPREILLLRRAMEELLVSESAESYFTGNRNQTRRSNLRQVRT